MPINIDGSKGIRQNTTEVTKIPVGTTAQRPANPEAGMIRFNTDEGFVEWYDDVGDRWLATSSFPGVAATGGTVTEISQDGQLFRVHTFTSDGTFDVVRGGEVEYLVVGGGGGGGADGGNDGAGGGGGAGGLVFGSSVVTPTSFSLIVGSGGVGRTGRGAPGGNGEDSTGFGAVALGGGGGGNFSDDGVDGGSGGGTFGRNNFDFGDGGAGLQPASASGGFGNDGGARTETTTSSGGAGGGGAGAPGATSTASGNGQPGGDGLDFSTFLVQM